MPRRCQRKGGPGTKLAHSISSSSRRETSRRPCLTSFSLLVIISLFVFASKHTGTIGPVLGVRDTVEPVQEKAASNAGNSDNNQCSSESLYQFPNHFGKCIVQNPSPSCQPKQTQTWDSWVGERYKDFPSCITPQLMKTMNREWAISGRGSSLRTTASLRKLLPEIFRDESLNIKTFFDCPSGDWLWMQEVDLSSLQYFGGDITSLTIQKNTECFERSNVHFHVLDWSCSIPPPVDLLMVRDVLFHLATSVVLDVLRNINKSGAKYLLTTSFGNNMTTAAEDNYSPEALGYRNINLYAPPYNFPSPIMIAHEKGGRHMGLWKLPIPVK
jgi:hypothetical protein